MKIRSYRNLISLFLILSLAWPSMPVRLSAAASTPGAGRADGIEFARPLLRFEVNEGQTNPQVRFTARDRGGIAYLTSGETVLQITKPVAKLDLKPGLRKASYNSEARSFESSFVRLKAVGANPNPRVVGLERLPGVTNYFIGNDRRKWRTNVAGYAKVKYEAVYPGVDLVYYGSKEGHLEYDFIVAPGADPGQIAMSVEGAQGVELQPSGDLVISTATGTIRQPAPLIYQEIGGKRQEIAGRYRMVEVEDSKDKRESAIGNQMVAFALGAYDVNRPLVIDPQVIYATYLGGSSTSTIANEGAGGVAVDAQGSAYIVGVTQSADFPTKNPVQPALKGFTDAFITKLDARGQLVYSTYLGGSGFDFDGGTAIKVDETGVVYVGGSTSALDFPTVNPVRPRGGRTDAFLTKLSPSGSQIVYSTYLGGTDNEQVTDLALDAQRNLFVVGDVNVALGTPANDFPIVNPIQATHGGGFRDGFLSIISTSGSTLLFSTYLGGDGDDAFQSIDVDPNNRDVLLGAFSDSTNFLTDSSRVLSEDTIPDFIIYRVEIEDVPTYLARFGGAKRIKITSPSPDRGGKQVRRKKARRMRAGETVVPSDIRPQHPHHRQLQVPEPDETVVASDADIAPPKGFDARVTVLDQNLNVTNTVFFGGSGEDTLSALEVDARGAAYLIGRTRSTDLPTVNPIQPKHAGGHAFDGFLAVLHPRTFQPRFATYLGGIGMESLSGITVDPQGNIYVVGGTFGNFPTPTPGAIQSQLRGRTDAFIIKISPVKTGPASVTISLTPSFLDFGNVRAGQSAVRTFTITNPATSTDALTGAVGTLSAPFSVVSGGGVFTLAPGQAKSVAVRFSPTAVGLASTNLPITHNATNRRTIPTKPTGVLLRGVGVT